MKYKFNRCFYTHREEGLSKSNEPCNSIILKSNIRQYPDMLYIYENFCNIFKIQKKYNVILGNGFENVLKNTMLALKSINLNRCYWSKPTWGFIDVICQQLNIKQTNLSFKFNEDKNILNEQEFNIKKNSIFYTTVFANNYYYNNINYMNVLNSSYSIFDMSYLNINDIKRMIFNFNFKGNIILMGSFDKMYGCGLRCGFAIFPDSLIDHIHLQREQYINALAANFIINYKKISKIKHNNYINKIKSFLTNKKFALTNNYITFKLNNKYSFENINVPFKMISIKSDNFIRFGIPHNGTEFKLLFNIIKKMHE